MVSVGDFIKCNSCNNKAFYICEECLNLFCTSCASYDEFRCCNNGLRRIKKRVRKEHREYFRNNDFNE